MRISIPTNITTKKAAAMQERLAPQVEDTSDIPKNLASLVGCDATYFNGTTVAAAVLTDYNSLQPLRIKTVRERTRFPYIPGLLAFREAPAVLQAIRNLRANSYVCMVDAHGRAHPRKFGLACFVGLALDRPTIGVAKSLLYGSMNGTHVLDEHGYPIAVSMVLPGSGKTIYVSVGHKISLKDAVKLVKHSLTPQGPVPIKLAHEEVTKEKWRIMKSNPASS